MHTVCALTGRKKTRWGVTVPVPDPDAVDHLLTIDIALGIVQYNVKVLLSYSYSFVDGITA